MHLHGRALCYESVPALALAAYVYGVEYFVDPADDEEWPDYVSTDARLLMQVNEELRQVREEARLRFGVVVEASSLRRKAPRIGLENLPHF